jgi:hypothetical protein
MTKREILRTLDDLALHHDHQWTRRERDRYERVIRFMKSDEAKEVIPMAKMPMKKKGKGKKGPGC